MRIATEFTTQQKVQVRRYSKQLDFRQGVNEASNRSVQMVHEDCERVYNAVESSSAKSIRRKVMPSSLMPTYNSLPVAFAYGKGAWLWDTQGNKYLDGLSGLAVCSLGHAHPAIVA